jgi:hypothetical protein
VLQRATGLQPLRKQASGASLDRLRADQLLEPPGVGADRVRARQGQAVEHLFGGPHRLGRERRDAPGQPGHEPVQLGVSQRPVDPAVAFGHLGVDVAGAQDHLQGPAPAQQPRQVLHPTGARGAPKPTSGWPRTAFSRAAKRMSQARASSLPAPRARPRSLAIVTTGRSLRGSSWWDASGEVFCPAGL